jgi:hypothetical protein
MAESEVEAAWHAPTYKLTWEEIVGLYRLTLD